MPDDSPHSLDEILAHRAWVSGLAASLLFDQTQVDDVVQETWLVALKSRPRDAGATRAWLGGIVRNLVGRKLRGESRRRRRETAAALPKDAPDVSLGAGVDDVVAQTELHSTLVEAVLALDEPYRTTVLLRYFRDLSAEEIARRTDVPGSTVRNRLRRALELLRTRLDQHTGGPPIEARRAWMLALVPLALAPEVAAGAVVAGTTLGVGTGVALMAMKTKLLGSLAALLVTVFGVWWVMEPGTGSLVEMPLGQRGEIVLPEGEDERAAVVERTTALPTAEPGEALSLAADPEGAAVVEAPGGDALTGLVVDEAGAPLAGAEVRFARHASSTLALLGVSNEFSDLEALSQPSTEGVFTDGDGRFALHPAPNRRPDRNTTSVLVVLHPDYVRRIHVNAPLTAGRPHDLGTIRMSPGATVFGRVVDEQGAPLAGVDIEQLEARPNVPTSVHSGADVDPGHFRMAQRTIVRTRSGADGRFNLSGLAPGQVDLKLMRLDLTVTALRDLEVDAARPLDLGTWTLARGLSLVGVVQDRDGQPVQGAEVYALARGAPDWWPASLSTEVTPRLRGQMVSDAEGRFRFGGLADAVFDLHAVAPSTAFTHLENVTPGAAAVTLTLEPPGVILLHVEDAETGLALPEARFGISLPDEYEEVERFIDVRLFSRFVDDEKGPGHWRITGAGREGTELNIRLKGYRRLIAHVPPVASGETIEYVARLEKALVLSGFIIDEHDEPIEDIAIQTAIRQGSKKRVGGASDRSAEDGSFTLDGIAGEWNIWISEPDFQYVQADSLAVPRSSDKPYVIRLLRNATIEGLVSDVHGQPVPGASVVALPKHVEADASAPVDRWRNIPVALAPNRPARTLVTQADEHGVYRLLELHPSDWVLIATPTPDMLVTAYRHAGGIPAELPSDAVAVHPAPGEITQLPLQLVAGSQVAGRITDDGAPVAGALVRLVPTPDNPERWAVAVETLTDDHGLYALEAAATGPAVIVANRDAGYSHWMPVDLTKGEEARTDIDLAGATLNGRVVDATSRDPLPGAYVYISPHAKDGWWAPAYPGMTADKTNRLTQSVIGYGIELTTDEAGRFTTRDLPPARYYVRAEATGHMLLQEHATVSADDDPHLVTVALPRAAIVTGTALDGDGKPLRNVSIALLERGSERIVAHADMGGGAWTMDPVDVGTWELRLVTRGENPAVLATERVTVGAGDRKTVEFVVD